MQRSVTSNVNRNDSRNYQVLRQFKVTASKNYRDPDANMRKNTPDDRKRDVTGREGHAQIF